MATALDELCVMFAYELLDARRAAASRTSEAAIPCDSSLTGVAAFLQVLEIDQGASKGVSFSAGLVLSLGA